ncbi:hypothetical protein HZC00_01205 [Candidatus Kaiserbacteria bacterium]|nr:hypothetical protein [Candidatus Kaiserbacteria bacterium]
MTKKDRPEMFRYIKQNFMIVLGLVLIWRGIWHLLDAVDIYLLGGNPFITTVLGIFVGFALLYIPDHDLKEIEQL